MTPDHVLKSWVGLFDPIYDGRKSHDLRVLDRDYKVGQVCLLREYSPIKKEYTGRECLVRINYVTSSQHGECAVSPMALHPATGILSICLIKGEPRQRIFVFGSNLAGRHGAGSALEARKRHGAEYGVGSGPTGNAYAIPTKSTELTILPLHTINLYVMAFLDYARAHPELDFDIVAIGCGLAGYRPAQIAPMFAIAPENCHLPPEFKP